MPMRHSRLRRNRYYSFVQQNERRFYWDGRDKPDRLKAFHRSVAEEKHSENDKSDG